MLVEQTRRQTHREVFQTIRAFNLGSLSALDVTGRCDVIGFTAHGYVFVDSEYSNKLFMLSTGAYYAANLGHVSSNF